MRAKQIRALNELAIRALGGMWSREKLLFGDRVLGVEGGVPRTGTRTNTRYTAMSLIGLHEAWRCGYRFDIPTEDIADRFLAGYEEMDPDELGLALWVNALYQKRALDPLLRQLDRYEGRLLGGDYRSMEVAWILRGLSECHAVAADAGLRDRALRAKDALLGFFCADSGLFRAVPRLLRRKNMLLSLKNYQAAAFAAQIYPVHALAGCHRVFGADDALAAARACARTLTRLQGPRGQWWWIYHPARARVIEKYPVYSVHQDGMAPMALLELQEASGESYEDAVHRGLDWIYGNNELEQSLLDEEQSLVWRAIQRREPGGQRGFGMGHSGHANMTAGALLGGANFQWLQDRCLGFEMLRETRSYHYGWILTAFAGRGD